MEDTPMLYKVSLYVVVLVVLLAILNGLLPALTNYVNTNAREVSGLLGVGLILGFVVMFGRLWKIIR